MLIALGYSDEQGGILISLWEVSYCSAPWAGQGQPGQRWWAGLCVLPALTAQCRAWVPEPPQGLGMALFPGRNPSEMPQRHPEHQGRRGCKHLTLSPVSASPAGSDRGHLLLVPWRKTPSCAAARALSRGAGLGSPPWLCCSRCCSSKSRNTSAVRK